VTNKTPRQEQIEIEQAYVDRVNRQLLQEKDAAKRLAHEAYSHFSSTRDTWFREELSTSLYERDAFSYVSARRMSQLDSQHDGLVFGRLDFHDHEVRYIGRMGVRTNDYEPLVIDWRAQSAEAFYRATPIDPMGVVRRRVLTSRDEQVTAIEDDVLMPNAVPSDMVIIGDGALLAALERSRGHHMSDIVATIQAEQDRIIRAPYQGFTIITGGPGTGKTVVGLHRIAYMLYTHRRRFINGGVLIVGPSAVFMDYISQVLPSLGEDAVSMESLGSVASDVLATRSSETDTPAAAWIKGRPSMVTLLRRLVSEQAPDEDLTLVIDGEALTIPTDRLMALRQRLIRKQPYNACRAALSEGIWRLAVELGRGLVDVLDDKFRDKVWESANYEPFVNKWWPVLRPEETLAQLTDASLIRRISQLDFVDSTCLANAIRPNHWTIADMALLDELAAILGPVPSAGPDLFSDSPVAELVSLDDRLNNQRIVTADAIHDTFAHILVDEAQDVTPMQWRMLRRRGPAASWTILGDPAQSSWPVPQEITTAFQQLVGTRQQQRFLLTTNYRSPKESYDLATSFIRRTEPTADIPESVRATGVPPELLLASSQDWTTVTVAAVQRLIDQVQGTIVVIGLANRLSQLREHLPMLDRLELLDPLSVKGLEFDATLIVHPDEIVDQSVSGHRILYVCLTRPTQRLTTIDIDSPGLWRPTFSGRLHD
jgi:DNA helicase IV